MSDCHSTKYSSLSYAVATSILLAKKCLFIVSVFIRDHSGLSLFFATSASSSSIPCMSSGGVSIASNLIACSTEKALFDTWEEDAAGLFQGVCSHLAD